MLNKSYLNKRIIIKEKIEAPIIFVNKVNSKKNGLIFFKKHKRKINYLDRVLTNLYEYPINYFNQNKDKFSISCDYKFHYIYDNKPSKIEYNTENKLILTSVFYNKPKSNNLYLLDNKQDFFEQNNIIDSQLDNDLYLKINNLEHYSYSTFVNNINPNYKSNLNNKIANGVDILIIGDNLELIKKISYSFNRNKDVRISNDKNVLIIKAIIDFVNSLDLNTIYYDSNGNYYHDYIQFIYQLYRKFYDKYPNLNVEIPDFMNNKIFALNKRYIKNTVDNDNLFKLFLNIFNKQKRFNNLMISEEDFIKYNNVIYNINKSIKSKDKDLITFIDFIKKK